MKRFEYQLKLDKTDAIPAAVDGISWRNPSAEDKQILAELMLDAYRGTIDFDDETLEDALHEVESYFSGGTGAAWPASSWLAFDENILVCASLVSFWDNRNVPLLAYVMTSAAAKGKHLATAAVGRSLQSLIDQGHSEIRAVITDGNIPSEKVFAKLGFARVNPD